MPKVLNVEKLEKKFSAVTKSKDSIQNLSHWIIHHKSFHDEICRHWLTSLEKSDSTHRLTLFYVANDVLQHCKKKNAVEFRVAFAEVLEDAVLVAKGDVIKDEILRMISIWSERNVYSADYLLQLSDILNNTNPNKLSKTELKQQNAEEESSGKTIEKVDEAKIIANFKAKSLISSLQQLGEAKRQAAEKHMKMAAYKNCTSLPIKPWDRKINSETIKKYQELVHASQSIENFISTMEREVDIGKKVLRLLEHGQVFYATQNDEVRHVVHAYRIFNRKLKVMQEKLDEKIVTLPKVLALSKSPSPSISECELSLPSSVNEIGIANKSVIVAPPPMDEESPLSDIEPSPSPPRPHPVKGPMTPPSAPESTGTQSNSCSRGFELASASSPKINVSASFVSNFTSSASNYADLMKKIQASSPVADGEPDAQPSASICTLEKRLSLLTHQTSLAGKLDPDSQDEHATKKSVDDCPDEDMDVDGESYPPLTPESRETTNSNNLELVSAVEPDELRNSPVPNNYAVQRTNKSEQFLHEDEFPDEEGRVQECETSRDPNANESSPQPTKGIAKETDVPASDDVKMETVTSRTQPEDDDPPANTTEPVHLTNSRTDCTKTTFTCLKTPECSIQETSNNPKDTLSGLLDCVKLLCRMMPKDSAAAEETLCSELLPLGTIFKVMSRTSLSSKEIACVLERDLATTNNAQPQNIVNKSNGVPEDCSNDEDNLMPMDMELDSDNET